MNDWEYDMWWDSVNSLEEDYDDMDDWQGGRPINFSGIYKINRSYEIFFVRQSYETFLAIFRVYSIIELSKAKEKPKNEVIKKVLQYRKSLQV